MRSKKQPEYWMKLKEKLETEYPQLKKSDLSYSKGNETDTFRIIANILRKTKQELWEIIAKL